MKRFITVTFWVVLAGFPVVYLIAQNCMGFALEKLHNDLSERSTYYDNRIRTEIPIK